MVMYNRLKEGFSLLGLSVNEEQIDQLIQYANLLLEQNEHMNLTAITDPLKICDLHFLDSACLLNYHTFAHQSVIDVGTGAGFPGIVLRILEPTIQLTLLDSLKKRLDWLESVCDKLNLKNVQFIHGRAEECSLSNDYREQYDIATARAVASLPILTELCLPYVKPNGNFLAMKTQQNVEELNTSLPIVKTLGGDTPNQFDYTLPFEKEARRLLIIHKIANTPKNYPRKWSKIKQGFF